MRIAVDAMGGDLGPGVVVQGAVRALASLAPQTEILLVGDEIPLRSHLGPQSQSRVEISANLPRERTATAPLSCCAPVTQYGKR